MSAHKITAAASPLVINEHEFEAFPITDRGWDELDMWLQSEVIRIAEDSMREKMDEAENDEEKLRVAKIYQDLTLPTALKTSLSVSYQSDVGQTILKTIRGLARIAWQMVKKGNVKYSEILGICRKDPDVAQAAILRVLIKFHGSDEEPKGNE